MSKKAINLVIVCLTLALTTLPMTASAQDTEPTLKMVANGKVESTLLVDGEKFVIEGRTSIYFEATEREFADGVLRAKGFNIVHFQVPQAALTHDKIADERKGALGFALAAGEKAQYVRYNSRKLTLSGRLKGYMDADYMADMAGIPEKGEDYVETPKQMADIAFRIRLSDPLLFKDTGKEVISQEGAFVFDVTASEDFLSDAKAYKLSMERLPIGVETSIFKFFEVARRLKIQPVRIARFKYVYPKGFLFKYTGIGLNFGMPQVKEQWMKADVVFSLNKWITLWKPSYWIFDSTESAALRAEVNVEDAVEVFFVYDFSPESMWGGGATWGLGLSSSKIITSDGNARGGIDFTHLAHELGHAIGLPHPDGTPGVSTGTLMCPSGWMNDNPQVNSQENKDNVSNPLFTFALKLISAGPDCTDSADCGSCF